MALIFYDEALVAKIKNWTSKTNTHIYGPSDNARRLFEIIGNETGDKPIKLPLISIRRAGGYTILNPNKKPLTFDGARLDATAESGSHLNAIPISIPYVLDVYCRYDEEADAYMRNLIFNFINYPTFKIVIPYEGKNYDHIATIRINPDVETNSDIPEVAFKMGQFARKTISLYIDDAYLWDVRVRGSVYIDSGCLEIDGSPYKEDEYYIEENI